MRVRRICSGTFADTAYSGIGAQSRGGRWNEKGVAVVYTSGSFSLAILETFVHLEEVTLPDDLVVAAEIPDAATIEHVRVEDLPRTWRRYPAPRSLRRLGSRWARGGRTLLLAVPSAVNPQEQNYLINPMHPQFRDVVVLPPEPFAFDRRMIKSPSSSSPPPS